MVKDKIWYLKLVGLTIAIWFFITKGFSTSVSESFGIDIKNREVPTWLIVLLVAYFAFVIVRGYYHSKINKPKDELYKKYREFK